MRGLHDVQPGERDDLLRVPHKILKLQSRVKVVTVCLFERQRVVDEKICE